MKRFKGTFFIMLFLSYLTTVFAATADQWVDDLISWNDVAPFSAGDPLNILGPIGDGGLSISDGDELIVAFSDNYVFDGPGNDLYFHENIDASELETIDVWASSDGFDYFFLGNAINDEAYDLFDYTELNSITSLKLVGTSLGGSSPGYDLLGIEALNSAAVPIPGAFLLFGSGAILLAGIRKKMMMADK